MTDCNVLGTKQFTKSLIIYMAMAKMCEEMAQQNMATWA
jgi:hypothetical protein